MQPVAIVAVLVAEGAVGGVVLGALLAIASLQLTRWWRARRAVPVQKTGRPALARFIDTENPNIMDGIVQQTNGFEDAYLIEGGQMAEYTMEDPGQLGTFVAVGDLPDNNGGIGNFEDFSAGG